MSAPTATYEMELSQAVEGMIHTYHTESDILGASKIDTYRDCPKAYELQYVAKIEVPKSPAMLVGSCVHEVLRKAHAERWTPDDAAEAGQLLRDLWVRVAPHTRRDGRGEAIGRVETLATRGLPWYLRWQEGQISIATEERWRQTVPGTDIELQGTWDRLYRHQGLTVVSDCKSGKHLPRDMDSDLQLTLYSWAYRQMFGKPEDAMEIVGVGLRKAVRTVRDDAFNQSVIETVVLPVAAAISRGDFPPNTNNRYGCSYCDYQDACPAGRARRAA